MQKKGGGNARCCITADMKIFSEIGHEEAESSAEDGNDFVSPVRPTLAAADLFQR